MAVRTTTFGTRTQFTNYTNLNSLANNAAKPLAVVDNSTTKADRYDVEVSVTLGASSVSATGTIEWYLINALQNSAASDWTDGIDPAGTSDISSSLKNARCIRVSAANANSQVVRERFVLPARAMKFFTLVALNKTGAAFASSGNDAQYMSVKDDIS